MNPGAANVSCVWAPGTEWSRLQRDLTTAGVSLPVQADPAFPTPPGEQRFLFAVNGTGGLPCWGVLGFSRFSRSLRWLRVIRLVRASCSMPQCVRELVAESIVDLARSARSLRVHVGLHDPDPAALKGFRDVLLTRGFAAVSEPRAYIRTVLIDLRPAEDQLLASFHPTCRRGIRAPAKHGLHCRVLVEPELATRLNELVRETMQRTGGTYRETDWISLMRFCTANPRAAQLMGVFRSDQAGDASLVGFVLGVRHGDTVEYDIAASTRATDLKVPLLYLPTWETMRWAKREGARWFDFGGISHGSSGSSDPTGGISDFKRYFSAEATPIGDELVYHTMPRLNAAESSISALMSAARRFSGRRT